MDGRTPKTRHHVKAASVCGGKVTGRRGAGGVRIFVWEMGAWAGRGSCSALPIRRHSVHIVDSRTEIRIRSISKGDLIKKEPAAMVGGIPFQHRGQHSTAVQIEKTLKPQSQWGGYSLLVQWLLAILLIAAMTRVGGEVAVAALAHSLSDNSVGGFVATAALSLRQPIQTTAYQLPPSITLLLRQPQAHG